MIISNESISIFRIILTNSKGEKKGFTEGNRKQGIR